MDKNEFGKKDNEDKKNNEDNEDKELVEINFKDLNHENYSIKKHKKKKGKGKRPPSPWWYLIGKVERRYYNKDCKEDFDIINFHNIKLQMKKKDFG